MCGLHANVLLKEGLTTVGHRLLGSSHVTSFQHGLPEVHFLNVWQHGHLHSAQALTGFLDCSHFLTVMAQWCLIDFPTNANCEYVHYELFQGSSMQGRKIFLCGTCMENSKYCLWPPGRVIYCRTLLCTEVTLLWQFVFPHCEVCNACLCEATWQIGQYLI